MIDHIQESPSAYLETRYAELLGSVEAIRHSPDRLAATQREIVHIVFELLQREAPRDRDEAA
ncbi:hypothetical protein [Sinomonas susongensis]|uniref:hypothetical protein n=1 Tax=Sinomonas susongensis TaxID=1324851 RepID=UPI0011083723|nr:hypothetical protein [Sinomonas susongensis]